MEAEFDRGALSPSALEDHSPHDDPARQYRGNIQSDHVHSRLFDHASVTGPAWAGVRNVRGCKESSPANSKARGTRPEATRIVGTMLRCSRLSEHRSDLPLVESLLESDVDAVAFVLADCSTDLGFAASCATVHEPGDERAAATDDRLRRRRRRRRLGGCTHPPGPGCNHPGRNPTRRRAKT